ncbi:hypothetical protein NPIL_610001 [Nephila pilipes]|uniref:Uncharacterized protein n=1 Tax=Nephila pilipes TaxID=299642 RepID=A0A8X6PBC7_NEPPI|nr:hypothetical protein NPIL_610001 [Nephila pilipes]
MDLPPTVSQKSYDRILSNQKSASSIATVTSMKNAANEEISALKTNEICVNGDGTWKTHGHTFRKDVQTQNSNESFNSTVWKYCPKTSGISKKVDDITVNEATIMYNDGIVGRLNIMKCQGCKLEHFSVTYAFEADCAEIKGAEIKSTLDAQRMKKKAMHEHFVEVEGLTYEVDAF